MASDSPASSEDVYIPKQKHKNVRVEEKMEVLNMVSEGKSYAGTARHFCCGE